MKSYALYVNDPALLPQAIAKANKMGYHATGDIPEDAKFIYLSDAGRIQYDTEPLPKKVYRDISHFI